MNKIEITALAAIALFFPLYVVWGNVFPSFEYGLNSEGTHGIQIKKRDFGGNAWLTNPYFQNYYLDQVDFKLGLEGLEEEAGLEIKAFKNYEAMAYPKTKTIDTAKELEKYLFFENDSGIPNGTLFSSKEAVYMVSRGEYRPVMNEEVFQKLGFDWDEIQLDKAGFKNKLSGEGMQIDYASPHPDGTVIENEDGKLFLVWREQLLEIAGRELLKSAWNDYYTIKAGNLEAFDVCRGKVGGEGELICRFKGEAGNQQGNAFIFRIENDDVSSENITKANSVLRTSINPENARKNFSTFVRNTKDSLKGIYGGYF